MFLRRFGKNQCCLQGVKPVETVAGHFAQTEEQADALAAHQGVETVELSHGRFEKRVCTITSDLESFHKSWKWHGLQTVVRIVRMTHQTGTREELSKETHYYLSSLADDAAHHADLVRSHWSVENTCRYVLDVTFGEDDWQVPASATRRTTCASCAPKYCSTTRRRNPCGPSAS